MSEHRATIHWSRDDVPFTHKEYGRNHTWAIAEQTVQASAAAKYFGDKTRIDPEAAMVGALSSSHMLTFLAVAAKAGHVVNDYRDEAVGFLERNEDKKLALTRVILRPRIAWEGAPPTAEQLEALHHGAHEHCFIANSVLTEVTVEAPE